MGGVMTSEESFKIECEHPDIMVVDSKANGLRYLFDDGKSRLAIAGQKGITMLTIRQAKALRDELNDIIELREVITARGGKTIGK